MTKETNHVDWFKSKEHEKLLKDYIESERLRIHGIIEKDGALPAVSLCVAMLAAYPSFMKTLGLKSVAINLLQNALNEAKK